MKTKIANWLDTVVDIISPDLIAVLWIMSPAIFYWFSFKLHWSEEWLIIFMSVVWGIPAIYMIMKWKDNIGR